MEEKLRQSKTDVLKIVLFGPESTGKTTLSGQLSRYYNTVWAPEYAREYLQNKWNNERKTCENSDLLPIAYGQMALENKLVTKANKLLICDTDLLETKVYSQEFYGGFVDPLLDKMSKENTYDLYLLTYIDIPWKADDLRDRSDARETMFKAFEQALIENNRPYILLKGDQKTRLKTATKAINNLLKLKTMHSEIALKNLTNKGISLTKLQQQIKCFENNDFHIHITDVATPTNGILQYSESEQDTFIRHYQQKQSNLDILKFVPASGAATRMFSELYQFVASEEETPYVKTFFEQLESFAFCAEVIHQLRLKHSTFDITDTESKLEFVNVMLHQNYLNFGKLPKGLIPFHSIKNDVFTPAQEHLAESDLYAKGEEAHANIHFTVSEDHVDLFKKHLTCASQNITYSTQKSSTDTVAVDKDNNPILQSDGSLLFRPGGHGALIENLNDLKADLIFVKNIDNVCTQAQNKTTVRFKQVLAGKLLKVQEQIFTFLLELENDLSIDRLAEIQKTITQELQIKTSKPLGQQEIITILNRPIRVCGMVKNLGEPGGGPFWVSANELTQLQIIEKSQIKLTDNSQALLLDTATHFNPVDLVCATKNYRGEQFNLTRFVDDKAVFISEKTYEGSPLKALELPGLWNGAMANWTTLFVEVPIATFNPVKTVNDLLKSAHQSK
ncbi:MAG: hypothetical protein COB81_04150 [Flavobacteriaceae bacterium]|nr:MAG: hypothetical protein COB81_04150 [Flavobacteriaceae bacterium]